MATSNVFLGVASQVNASGVENTCGYSGRRELSGSVNRKALLLLRSLVAHFPSASKRLKLKRNHLQDAHEKCSRTTSLLWLVEWLAAFTSSLKCTSKGAQQSNRPLVSAE